MSIPAKCPKCNFSGTNIDGQQTHWMLSNGICAKCSTNLWKYRFAQSNIKIEHLNKRINKAIEEKNNIESSYESQKYEMSVLEMEMDQLKTRNKKLSELLAKFDVSVGEADDWPESPAPPGTTANDLPVDYRDLVTRVTKIERNKVEPLLETIRKSAVMPCLHCGQVGSHTKECVVLELLLLCESL